MKILIMGLPGSGKTTLASKLASSLDCAWFNGDVVRKLCGHHDFSPESRDIQAMRMRTYADFETELKKIVICDFVCPTNKAREIFDADLIIWMNTISAGRYDDTNLLFEKPDKYDIRIKNFDYDISEITKIIKKNVNYK